MRVLLWVILGLTACAVVYGAKPQTAPSSNITTETSPGTATTLSSTLERPKKRHTESTVANSATTPVGEYRRRRRFRKKKKKVSTDFVKLPTTPGQLVTAQVSVTAAVSSPDDVTFGDSSPNAVTIAVSPSTAVTPKPSHHRRRHSRKRSKIHHRRRNSTTTATSGFTPIPESSSTNLTVAAASGATVSKTLATSGEPAASAKSSNAKQERRKDPTEPTDGHEDYTQPDDIAGYYDIDPEPFFTHSLSSLYSTRLGQDPAFSSSENYALYEGANVPDLKRENPRATVTLETVSVPPQRQCYTMQKPMPAYIHYGGKVEKTGATDHGPMMTCRVCGKKEDPFAGGGYTEDCSYSPDKQTNILENYKGIQKYDQPDYADIPFGSATTTQLYAGKGQSPYLNSNSARGHSSKKSHHDYNPYYGNYGGYHEYLPQATGTQTYGGNGGHGSGHGGDGGGKGSGDHGNGAGTGKSTCKIVYRGKMKCKICGDAKSDAIFSEQCDYERNDPGQHRATSYNYGSADDKKYKSPQGKGNGDGYGGGGGGYGGGHGGDFGPSGDDYGFGNNGGYGGDGFGGYNFPDYGGYGSGTGYGLSFDTDPFFGGHGDNYGVSGGGGGGGQGGDKYGGSTASGDGQKYGGSGDSKDYSSQQPQQAGSSQIADKHDNGEGGNKKNCKVIYKDVNSYSPYTKSQGDSKPKMKCMVCSQNNGGVTEECSYNGGGELTSKGAFPDSKDISAFYGSPLDSYYRPAGYDEYRAALF